MDSAGGGAEEGKGNGRDVMERESKGMGREWMGNGWYGKGKGISDGKEREKRSKEN